MAVKTLTSDLLDVFTQVANRSRKQLTNAKDFNNLYNEEGG